jgi:exportin-2 (importin alpha re-exporter)
MLTEPSVSTWYASVNSFLFENYLNFDCDRPTVLNVLLQLALSSDIPTKRDQPSDADDAIVTQLDYEESTAGYQASYSRLAASEPTSVDPVAYVPDARLFLKEALADLARRDGRVNALISRADQSLVQRLGQA